MTGMPPTAEPWRRRELSDAMSNLSPSGPLRVSVDLVRCQGYAQCCYAAPKHFRIEGHEALFYDPAPRAEHRADLERARIACPVQAIRIEDPATGEV